MKSGINRFASTIICLLFIVSTSAISVETDKKLKLTPTEQAWLKKHPKIKIGINKDWAPMNFIDYNGKPQGLGVDFIAELNKLLDNRLIIVPACWEDIYRKVKERDGLDALMDITPRKNRIKWFNFTRPYVVIPQTIFAKKGGRSFSSSKDIAGTTVAVEKEFYLEKELRSGRWGKMNVKTFQTTSEALFAVSTGKADVYIGNQVVAMYTITKELIPGLEPQCRFNTRGSVNSIGIRKDWPELAGILNKALGAIDKKTVNRILTYWGSKVLEVEQPAKKTQASSKKLDKTPRKGQDWTVPDLGMEFVWIKALKCWVGKYEVTNGEYRKLETGHITTNFKKHSMNTDNQPVACIGYDEAKAYTDWLTETEKKHGRLPLGYRYSLPTRKEWQTFAQCGDGRKYPWGDSWPPKYGNYHDKSGAGPWPKIEYYDDKYPVSCPVEKSGKNDWNLYGVGGNVWELTIKSPSDSSFDDWRGGSWRYGGSGTMQAPCHFTGSSSDPCGRVGCHGFRLVLSQRK
jgi:ABC-type amino acid transport substrate-binding protein